MALQNSAALIEATARSEGTDGKYDRSWSRWCRFLESIELGDDYFLDSISAEYQPAIFVCFTQAVRDGEYSRGSKRDLAQTTVREAMDQVAAVFRANRRDHPFKDGTKLDFEVDLLMKGYRAADPPEEQEVALTPSFLRQTYNRASNAKERHLSLLYIVAFFYAMRSCEYLITQGSRKTTNVCLRDIEFRNHRGGTITHQSLDIFGVAAVSVTFREQKNGDKWDRTTHEATADPLMNPVRVLAHLVTELWKLPGTMPDTPICTYYDNGSTRTVSASDALEHLRRVAKVLGEENIGFKPHEIGTHSLCSAAAMAMFLDNTPVFLIMLVGRWKSDGFLKYIRKQVLETSRGISTRMLKNDLHHVLPSPSSTIDDSRIRNRDSFASNLSSMALTSSRLQALRPAFSLYH